MGTVSKYILSLVVVAVPLCVWASESNDADKQKEADTDSAQHVEKSTTSKPRPTNPQQTVPPSVQQIMDLRKLVGSALEGTIFESTGDESEFRDALEGVAASQQSPKFERDEFLVAPPSEPQAMPRAHLPYTQAADRGPMPNAALGAPAVPPHATPLSPTAPANSATPVYPAAPSTPGYPYYTPLPPRTFLAPSCASNATCAPYASCAPYGSVAPATCPPRPKTSKADTEAASSIREMAVQMEAMANGCEERGDYQKADQIRNACQQMRLAARSLMQAQQSDSFNYHMSMGR